MAAGRRRKRDIERGDGCCAKFCAKFCRLSKWNQLICWGHVALTLMTLIVFITGAALAATAGDLGPTGFLIAAHPCLHSCNCWGSGSHWFPNCCPPMPPQLQLPGIWVPLYS